MKCNYPLIRISDVGEMVRSRWPILKSMLTKTPISNEQYKMSDKYEVGYRDFLLSFPRPDYNATSHYLILRYIQSLQHDLQGLLPFTDGKVHFYGYKDYECSCSPSRVKEFINESLSSINAIIDYIRSLGIDVESNYVAATVYVEDTLKLYQTELKIMAPKMIYSREIALGNQNLIILYLLEVHVRNCISTGTADCISTFENFLLMHNISGDIFAVRSLLALMLQFNPKKTIQDMYLDSKERLKTDYNIDHSIIAVMNYILACGEMPLSELPKNFLSDYKILVDVRNDPRYRGLRARPYHITDVFDIDNYQLSDAHINSYLQKVMIDYNMIPSMLDVPQALIDALMKNNMHHNDTWVITLRQLYYQISRGITSHGLLYRQKLISRLIQYALA